MGLNMYLSVQKDKYRSGYSYGVEKARALYPKSLQECIPNDPTDSVVSTTTSYRVGYWRKANAIHKWFVDNVQEGVDDCRRHPVSIPQLEELQHTCEKVLANHELAPIYLPTQEGFFFGSTQYDDYYFEVLEKTVRIIKSLIPAIQKLNQVNKLNMERLRKNGARNVWDGLFEVYYQASW